MTYFANCRVFVSTALLLLTGVFAFAAKPAPPPPPPSPAPIKYELTYLSDQIVLRSINADGIAAGRHNSAHPVIVSPSGEEFNLNDAPCVDEDWDLLNALGINAQGQVTGIGYYQGERVGYRYSPPVLSDTGEVLSAETIEPIYPQVAGDRVHINPDCMNDLGEVAFLSFVPQPAGNLRSDIFVFGGLPGNGGYDHAYSGAAGMEVQADPYGINNEGQITGGYKVDSYNGRAFRYTPGATQLELFGATYGTTTKDATGHHIDPDGRIIGVASFPTSTKRNTTYEGRTAILKSDGSWQDLGAAGDPPALITRANSSGVIVAGGKVWINGTAYAIKDLIVDPLPPNAMGLRAVDINDAGEICGELLFEGPDGGFILTPIP